MFSLSLIILALSSGAIIYKEEGRIFGNYSNSSLEIMIFDSEVGGRMLEKFYTTTDEFNSWRIEENSNMKVEELYWKEYVINNVEVDWGVKKRERKPIFSTLNPLLKKVGEWVWELQLVVDALESRLNELSFIVVEGEKATFSKPISLQKGEVVDNIISYPQPVDPQRTLVTKKYVDSLIFTSQREIENLINNFSSGFPSNYSFLNLSDTPSSYAGEGGKFVMVKNDETGLTFRSISSSIPPHNQLAGLQGGNSNERYHLSYLEYFNLVSNMPFNNNSIIFSDGGTLDSDVSLTWNKETLVVNKTSYENEYALDVGGHINAVPICAKYSYTTSYKIPSSKVFIELEGSNSVRDPLTSSLFQTADLESSPPDVLKETLIIGKDGYYDMTLTFVLFFESVSVDFVGKVDFLVNGKIVKSYPIQIPSNKIVPYTHAVTISELLYLRKGDKLQMLFSYSNGKPSSISNIKEEAFTSFFICKVN